MRSEMRPTPAQLKAEVRRRRRTGVSVDHLPESIRDVTDSALGWLLADAYSWKSLNEDAKKAKIVLLINKEKKDGPHMGYWWKAGNHWVSSSSPSWLHHPTHYIDLSDLC